MFVKLFGLLLFWGIGAWVLHRVWTDYRRGYGPFFGGLPAGYGGPKVHRKDDPIGFWSGLILNAAFGIALFSAGITVFLFA
jgi:hypothetical protein